MNRHSVHLVCFELSIFVVIVLLNYNTRTKTENNPLEYAAIKGDVATINNRLSIVSDFNKIQNQKSPIFLSEKLKTDKIINMPVDDINIKHDAAGTYIWTCNGSKFIYMSLIQAVHEYE